MPDDAEVTPLVTVVIPVHNGKSTLSAAIESVVGQSYEDLEIIVVDDGSIDDSTAVVEDWRQRDDRVTLIRHSPASGSPNRPRNIGVGAASGEFIALLDQDDVWLTDKLRTQVARLIQTGASVCYSRCLIEDLTYDAAGRADYHQRWSPELTSLPEGDVSKALLVSDIVPCCTAVFRRGLHDELGGFSETLRATSDYEFWLRASFSGATFCAVHASTAVYRWSPDNLSHQSMDRRLADQIELWEGLRRNFPDEQLREKVRLARDDAASERLYYMSTSGLSLSERARTLGQAVCMRPDRRMIWFHVRRLVRALRRKYED